MFLAEIFCFYTLTPHEIVLNLIKIVSTVTERRQAVCDRQRRSEVCERVAASRKLYIPFSMQVLRKHGSVTYILLRNYDRQTN